MQNLSDAIVWPFIYFMSVLIINNAEKKTKFKNNKNITKNKKLQNP